MLYKSLLLLVDTAKHMVADGCNTDSDVKGDIMILEMMALMTRRKIVLILMMMMMMIKKLIWVNEYTDDNNDGNKDDDKDMKVLVNIVIINDI